VAAELVACFKAAMAVAENGGAVGLTRPSRDRAVGIGMFLSSAKVVRAHADVSASNRRMSMHKPEYSLMLFRPYRQ